MTKYGEKIKGKIQDGGHIRFGQFNHISPRLYILEKKFSSKKCSKLHDKEINYLKMAATSGVAVFAMEKILNQWLL
jgi:hypothetical protein